MKAAFRYHLLFFVTIGLASPGLVQANPAEEVAAIIEREQMRWLHEQQVKPGVTIDEFKTDGCSGGMSQIWTSLAEMSPEFARRIGKQPPWESCCVSHDRYYWRGESANGYEKRLAADRELQQCVSLVGKAHATELAGQLGVTRAEVVELTDLTADLMYTAVRLGGRPCSGFPWRWGHGWPECQIPLPGVVDQNN